MPRSYLTPGQRTPQPWPSLKDTTFGSEDRVAQVVMRNSLDLSRAKGQKINTTIWPRLAERSISQRIGLWLFDVPRSKPQSFHSVTSQETDYVAVRRIVLFLSSLFASCIGDLNINCVQVVFCACIARANTECAS